MIKTFVKNVSLFINATTYFYLRLKSVLEQHLDVEMLIKNEEKEQISH